MCCWNPDKQRIRHAVNLSFMWNVLILMLTDVNVTIETILEEKMKKKSVLFIQLAYSSSLAFHFPEYFDKLPESEFQLVAFSFQFATEHESFSGLCFSCQEQWDVCVFTEEHNLWLHCTVCCIEGDCQWRSLHPYRFFDRSLPQQSLNICSK